MLLVRLDGIGDALVCAPLVAALRDAGHELGAVFSTRNREAFAPGVFAHVHVLERIPWPKHGSTPASWSAALAEARALHYDVALIVSEELEAYEFARAAGIARRVGFVNGWEKPLKTLRVRALLDDAIVRPASAARVTEHEVETVFRLGNGLHAEAGPTRETARLAPLVLGLRSGPVTLVRQFTLITRESATDSTPAADEVLMATPVPNGPATRTLSHGRVVLQLSNKLAQAGLAVDAWLAIARALADRCGPVLALSDDAELAAAARAAGLEVLQPDTAAWKETIAGARALVAPDSGAIHVAGMTGVPSLALFAPGRAVERDIARWSAWAAPSLGRVFAPPAGEMARRVAGDLERLLVEGAVR